MKKPTQSKTQASKKPATKPTTKPATKTSTKPATKAPSKPAAKTGATKKEQPKKPCDKKATNTKEKDISVDKRAFVSGEAPKKFEKEEMKIRTSMKCIKTIQAHDDWVEKAIIVSNGKVVTAWYCRCVSPASSQSIYSSKVTIYYY